MSECEPKAEEQHLWDFRRHKELSRPDAEVDNINDLHKLYAMREEDENRKKQEKELKADCSTLNHFSSLGWCDFRPKSYLGWVQYTPVFVSNRHQT